MIRNMNSQHYNADKLKQLREGKGLTQNQAAEALSVDRQTIYRAEAGLSASYELLCSLADLYEVEVISLLHPRPVAPSKTANNFLSIV